MAAPEIKPMLSDKHFSVDGTWASHASMERIDGQYDLLSPPSGPGEGFAAPKSDKKRAKWDFRGIKLSNKTHRFSTDPDAFLCRKSNAHLALPNYRGNVLLDNRHALIVDCSVTQAVGTGERDAAKTMAAAIPGAYQKTLCADKNYDCDDPDNSDSAAWRHTARGAEHSSSCWFSDRWPHQPPRGLRQVNQRPPRARAERDWLPGGKSSGAQMVF